jgi:hypothetical protein
MSETKRPLKVFPSTGSGHRLSYAHADAKPACKGDLRACLPKDGVIICL